MRGQITITLLIWGTGLLITGLAGFFNLKGDVSVLEEREDNHYNQVMLIVEKFDKKLDKLIEAKELVKKNE